MKKLAWTCVAVIAAFLPSTLIGQVLAERPEWLPGENWTYHQKDIKSGGYLNFRHEMQSKDGDVYVLREDSDNGTSKRQMTVRRSLDLNRLRAVNGQSQDNGWFRFPLETGKTWQATERWTNNQGYDEVTFKVVGQERLTVAAGTFDTIKVEGTGFWHNETPSGWTTGRDDKIAIAVWFAPEVKSYVRFQRENWWKGQIEQQWAADLIAAQVKKGDALTSYGSTGALSEVAKQ
jgi:hypothetical protein